MSIRRAAFGVTFFGLGLLPVLAADLPNPVGFPKKNDGGGDGVFRVWFADGAWHLRTSTENTAGKKDKLLVFSGTVKCNDKMTVEGKFLEKKGKGKTADYFTPHANGKGFDFQFKTYNAIDQVDFKVGDKAKSVTFKFFYNGEKAPTQRIAIGEKSEHPEKHEFTLPAHPQK